MLTALAVEGWVVKDEMRDQIVKGPLAPCFDHHRMPPRPATESVEQRHLLHGKAVVYTTATHPPIYCGLNTIISLLP
jgi:hypothetical protein